MKKKLIEKLNWQVWCFNINGRKMSTTNVFTLSGNFIYFFDKAIKAYDKTKDVDAFVKDVEGALRYAHWAKCEYEVIIAGLFDKEGVKVDIYEQVKLNWDRFVDYLLTTLEIKKGAK